jgi:hypothetical protein
MKRLMFISDIMIYNFTETTEDYIGWSEIPIDDHELTSLIDDYEETVAELMALQQRIDLAIIRCKMFDDDKDDMN